MKKIAFLMLHLGYGGAEQAVISEANLLAQEYEVEIICFYQLYDKPAFSVDSKVKITYLTNGIKPNKEEIKVAITNRNYIRLIKEGLKSIKILYLRKNLMKQAIKKCSADIIISSRYLYHKLLTKNVKKGTICIAQEHNHHNGNKKYTKKQVNAVKNMDYFMPVSKELTDFYALKMKNYGVKCVYIPHHLENIPENNSNLMTKNIISVGRLSPEKNFQELIRIFKDVSKVSPEWMLHIVGDGVEKNTLEELIVKYNLQNKVILHGYRDKNYIANLMYQSSIYVMTSLTESFGLVLIEAQSFGIPCIAYDCAQGAKEIIESGVNGILIKKQNHDEMVKEIIKLMCNYDYRKKIGENGKLSIENFSKCAVEKKWYEFINSMEKMK